MERLIETMRRLRAPDGCPWDRKQTHLSLRRYLLEEAAEAVDAITAGRRDAIVDELGDVLLQVAFHSVIAEEDGSYTYADIEEAIVGKLIRRHPHIFGDVTVSGADEVVANWEEIKAEEREARGEERHPSPVERVSRSLPALMRAAEVASAAGWEAPAEVEEMVGPDAREIGRHLLEVAAFARARGVDPELALREAIDEAVERAAKEGRSQSEEAAGE